MRGEGRIIDDVYSPLATLHHYGIEAFITTGFPHSINNVHYKGKCYTLNHLEYASEYETKAQVSAGFAQILTTQNNTGAAWALGWAVFATFLSQRPG